MDTDKTYDGPVLEIENLCLSYFTRAGEVPAVVDFSLTLEQGDSVGLVGESGCGKSTVALGIMRYMGNNGGIVGGSIKFMGRDMAEGRAAGLEGNRMPVFRRQRVIDRDDDDAACRRHPGAMVVMAVEVADDPAAAVVIDQPGQRSLARRAVDAQRDVAMGCRDGPVAHRQPAGMRPGEGPAERAEHAPLVRHRHVGRGV